MIEIHNIPTSAQYVTTATEYSWSNNQLVAGTSYNNICFYQSDFQLESGKIGYNYKMQVSTNIISSDPTGKIYEIKGRKYEVLSAKIAKAPGRVPFWQCNLKSKNKASV